MDWIKRFFPPTFTNISKREKIFSGLAAFVAIFISGAIAHHFTSSQAVPFLVASVGASAVLVFVIHSSPLSQPWPVLGGHIVSAFVGVCTHLLIEDLVLASALAVSVSILLMYVTRCMHPPGGAAALGAVMGGPQVHAMGFSYLLFPVALNAFLIIILAIILNRFVLKRTYPASQPQKKSLSNVAAEWALGAPRFKNDDLQAALKDMDSYIDVSQQDLARIYALAIMHANKRRMGEVLCRDIMSRNPITFRYDEELETAWQTLRQNNIKAAPIVDGFDRPLGIVTITDFVHHATHHHGSSLKEKVNNFLQRTHGHTSDKAEVVGQIMSTTIHTAKVDQHIIDLVPTFTEKGFHHMPVIDEQGKIAGMVTRAEVMRSMLLVRT